MSFSTLVAEVFRHGCGASMRTALESDEYRHIRQTLHELDTPHEADTALVELLGGRLADRAFRNIPADLRERAHEWQNGVDAQLQLLFDICQRLSTAQWRRIGNGDRSYEYNSDSSSVLPAAMGSWQQGKAQPNCLGVAQMTVGFARSVGARHYAANVVHSNQDTLLKYKIRTMRLIQTALKREAGLEELGRRAEQATWKALEVANRPTQAHHVLIVQLADESWWVVDPYLGALYSLSDCPEWEAATQWVDTHHHRVALVRPRTPLVTYIQWVNMYLQALEFACVVFGARFGPAKAIDGSILNLLSYVAASVRTYREPVEDLEAFTRSLANLEVTVNDDDQDTEELEQEACAALVYAAHDTEDFAELNATMRTSPDQVIARVEASLARATTDVAHEQYLAFRLVRYILKNFLQFLEDLHDDPNTRQHECLEVTWAPMGIGIATLNHVQGTALPDSTRSVNLAQTAGLQGRLSALFSGQWVLHDTLAWSREKGEPIHLDYLPAILQSLDHIREIPYMMITPLKLMSAYQKREDT